MNHFFYMLLNILIAGFIGGVTNHLAIKMLFYPRRALYVGKWKIPFTPGLIPKRREEVGSALGRVVADYLVTSHGLSVVLKSKELHQKWSDFLRSKIVNLFHREDTVRQVLADLFGEQAVLQGTQETVKWLHSRVKGSLLAMWRDRRLLERTAREIFPGWTEEKKDELAHKGSELLAEQLRQELHSSSGDAIIRKVTAQLLEQSGGFLGALAGMFMDGDKLNQKIKFAILTQLNQPTVRLAMAQFIKNQMSKMESMTLNEISQQMLGQEAEVWLENQLEQFLKWQQWADMLMDKNMEELFTADKLQWLDEQIPKLAEFFLNVVETHADRILLAIDLPKLVEEQVKDFPVERLEQIILHVSGREFRAITWLGVLLGGMVGLFQSLLLTFGRF